MCVCMCVCAKSKQQGLDKASGPQKAELSDILINKCGSIKGRLIGQRQRNCSAVTASPLRSDSTFRDSLRVQEGGRDGQLRGMTRKEGGRDGQKTLRSRTAVTVTQPHRFFFLHTRWYFLSFCGGSKCVSSSPLPSRN